MNVDLNACWFQADGASIHYAITLREYLDEVFSGQMDVLLYYLFFYSSHYFFVGGDKVSDHAVHLYTLQIQQAIKGWHFRGVDVILSTMLNVLKVIQQKKYWIQQLPQNNVNLRKMKWSITICL